nr:hypothetical protein [Tanacetum cinerariifolium]
MIYGDDGDDDDGDSFGDDADDEDEDEEDEEEKEHLALADSAIVIPADELVSPPKGTEPEHLALADSAIVIPTDELVSPPKGTEPVIPPPSTDMLPLGLGLPSDFRLPYLFHQRCTTLDASPLPPPLHMPPPFDRKDDIPGTEMLPRKRLCLSTLGSSTLDAEARRQGIG